MLGGREGERERDRQTRQRDRERERDRQRAHTQPPPLSLAGSTGCCCTSCGECSSQAAAARKRHHHRLCPLTSASATCCTRTHSASRPARAPSSALRSLDTRRTRRQQSQPSATACATRSSSASHTRYRCGRRRLHRALSAVLLHIGLCMSLQSAAACPSCRPCAGSYPRSHRPRPGLHTLHRGSAQMGGGCVAVAVAVAVVVVMEEVVMVVMVVVERAMLWHRVSGQLQVQQGISLHTRSCMQQRRLQRENDGLLACCGPGTM